MRYFDSKFNFSRFWTRLITWRLSFFLVVCVILGGTAQAIMTYKIPLYIISLIVIGSALTSESRKPLKSLMCLPVVLTGMFFVLYCVFLIPLPSQLWTGISGREVVSHGYTLAAMELPSLPLSLTPEKTLLGALSFLPPIAIWIVFKLSASEKEISNSVYAVVFIAALSMIFGIFQSVSRLNYLSLYEFYNVGYPVGFFANVNHQATLATTAIPLALYFSCDRSLVRRKRVFAFIGGLLLFTGTLITGSSAGFLLLILSLTVGLYILNGSKKYNYSSVLIVVFILLLFVFDALLGGGEIRALITKLSTSSELPRALIYGTGMEIQKEFGFWGTGPGSFSDVYRLFETRSEVTSTFVNEAHNDFLQIWVEMGVLGGAILVLGLGWLLNNVRKAITGPVKHRKTSLIYCLSLFIIVVHSVVDYPMRTIAISSIFMYLLLLIDREILTRD